MDFSSIFSGDSLKGDAMGAASGAATGAAFGPWGAVAGAAIGIGASIYGGLQAHSGQQASTQAQTNIIGLEQQAEAQRYNAMELTARRQSMEVLRNNQAARSMALNNATGQGAQFGSGLQGGYGQISGASNTNLSGIQQNLQIGENLFGINSQISTQKIALAQAGSQIATGNAISSLGMSVGSSISSLSRLSAFAGGKAGGTSNSGGNNSGYDSSGQTYGG